MNDKIHFSVPEFVKIRVIELGQEVKRSSNDVVP